MGNFQEFRRIAPESVNTDEEFFGVFCEFREVVGEFRGCI
jgi:hypothetical protein